MESQTKSWIYLLPNGVTTADMNGQSKPRMWRHMNNPGRQPGAGSPNPAAALKGRHKSGFCTDMVTADRGLIIHGFITHLQF